MSAEIELDDNRSITFKHSVSLTDLSKALGHFNKLYKLMAGRDAKYSEFTAWLVTTDFVDVGPSQSEINKIMEDATHDKNA